MQHERTWQIWQLYDAALARTPEDRAAFLTEACAGNEALKREVESLLAHQETSSNSGHSRSVSSVLATVQGNQSIAVRRIGPYEVQDRVGAGGMGEVYRARDTRLARDVAIKILPAAFTRDPDRLARFEREARILAALNHPNIAAIYGVEAADGVSALVLEFIDGPTLSERLLNGSFALEEALAIAHQVAEALEVAHERGIIHRDLKPANVKLTPRGAVKLLDFGIAVWASFDTAGAGAGLTPDLTAPGEMIGTVGYMSPEQVRGERVDARSDQFSWAVLVFEMLTGQSPFRRRSAIDTLTAILRDPPPPLAEVNHSVPPPVQWMVERCLAKNPEGRYASMHDLVQDIAALRNRLRHPLSAASLPRGAGGLPAPRTSLIGREADVAAARALLLREDVRLVTFTGPGGTGKTRLALQVAGDVESAFPGGIRFVPLASISDPRLLAPTIARAVTTHEIGNRDPTDVLKSALAAAGAPTLLVLDNFEQLLDGTPLIIDLLEHCAHLKLLVTSQAVLRLYGEHNFAVPPLEVPSRAARSSLSELAASSAVALFLQRARAVKPDFALTHDNALSIAELCARLDGLPLAIELAAARVRTLSPGLMLQRLERRFELLTGGPRDQPARQQTLRAAIDWSYGLLSKEEQRLFRRLAVFVNGCTLEAAEAVCNAADDLGIDVLDGMESLVGKSLVVPIQPVGSEPRFAMLESVREGARERLASTEDGVLTFRAHAAFYLVLAEESGARLTVAERLAWINRCDLEHDNFRAALDWTIRAREVEWGLRIGAALYPFWHEREYYGEGRERLTALLKLPMEASLLPARARALHVAGDLALHQGDHDEGRAALEEALGISRTLGDTAGILSNLNSLAVGDRLAGNLSSARARWEECLRLARETGNEAAIAQSLSNLAYGMRAEGNLAGAKELYTEALATFARCRDRGGVAWLESCLGDLERQRGDSSAAAEWYERAVETFAALGDQSALARTRVDLAALAFDKGEHDRADAILAEALTSFQAIGYKRGVARALDRYAAFAATRGEAHRALRLAGAAEAIRRTVGAAGLESERTTLMHELEPARLAAGEAAVSLALEGWAMTADAAVEYALNAPSRSTDGP